jgi:hypothetical protein
LFAVNVQSVEDAFDGMAEVEEDDGIDTLLMELGLRVLT